MSNPPPPRPSLRTIAAKAGVSAMTVSRVLRNLGKVSASKRQEIQAIAGQLGYRPDPEVAKLMHHLRARHKPSFQGLVCALTTIPAGTQWDYNEEVINGARARAQALGYTFTLLNVGQPAEGKRGLQRMLRARGVEGVLLLPLLQLQDISTWLDWDEFSVVATSNSILAPKVHRVLPSHFTNALLICRALAERGYQRIGFVIEAQQSARVGHGFTAAVEWHGRHEAKDYVPPFLFDGQAPEPAELQRWFNLEKPDVLLASRDLRTMDFVDSLGLEIPGQVGYARTSVVARSPYAGIDERPSQVGSAAIDLLTGMIQRGEKGVPTWPMSTLLPGSWVEGTSCPRRVHPTPVVRAPATAPAVAG